MIKTLNQKLIYFTTMLLFLLACIFTALSLPSCGASSIEDTVKAAETINTFCSVLPDISESLSKADLPEPYTGKIESLMKFLNQNDQVCNAAALAVSKLPEAKEVISITEDIVSCYRENSEVRDRLLCASETDWKTAVDILINAANESGLLKQS